MTTATITQISKALKLTRAAIYKRAEQWEPVKEPGVARYDIDTLQLRAGEVKKIKAFLARSACKIIPIHAIDKAAEAAEKERLRREARAHGLEMFNRLPAWQQAAASAKLTIMKDCELFINRNKLAKTTGQDLFCHEYNLGRIEVAPAVRDEIHQLHPGTLRAWISAEYELGMMGLVDMYGNRKGQSKIETYITGTDADGKPIKPMVTTILALISRYPHIKPKRLAEYLPDRLPDAPYVSAKSIERWIEAWKKAHPQEWDYLVNPDNWKNKHLTAAGTMDEGIRFIPNARWEIDATPADLLLTDGRYKIIGLIDVGTRRLILQVTPTEKGLDNARVVRRGILAWGVPVSGIFITDQGNPYKSELFRRFLDSLNIEQEFCPAYSGDRKPFIERSFRTFSHDLVELLPGYCGHSVADRKALESQKTFAQRLMKKGEVIEAKITAVELQAFCDRWIASYHNRVHGTLNKTPNQVVGEWPHAIHKISDERALDVLLSPVAGKGGWRRVGKKGIKVPAGWYNHSEFGNLSGQKVFCLETDNLSEIIINRENDHGVMEFVGIAVCAELAGISRKDVAEETRARQKEIIAQVNELKNALKQEHKGTDVASAVLTRREKKAAEANITYLPNRTIEYTTPGLQAAGEAARVLDGTTAPLQQTLTSALTPDQQAIKERMKAEMEQAKATNVASLKIESSRAKFKRMQAVRVKLDNRADVSVEEFAELRSYEQTNEYRAMKGLEEDARAVK